MAQEILLERRAMALLRRSEEPLIETLEDILLLRTPAVSQPLEPIGGPDQEEEPLLPSFGYYLDESDPDIVVVLRRQDGSPVAAFGAIGPRGKASSKPPERTTRRWLGRTRTI